MTTTKKNIKVKKGKGDISITIENNLNANNKQINHQPKAEGFIKPRVLKRRRRKKKVEDTEETLKQSLQELPPLKDVSYIKPGPVGAFKIWQNTMDSYNTTVPMNQAQQLGLVPPQLPVPPTQLSLPAPPTQPALPPPEQQQMLTFDNWKRAMEMMREQQQPPPASWGRELVDDDDEPRMPTSPAFSRLSKPSDLEYDMDFANELENSIAEEYGKEVNDPEIKEVGKEMQKILNKARTGVETIQAKRLGTLHANKKWAPTGKYKDTEAYKTAYNKAYNEQISKDEDEINEDTTVGRTRAGKKKVQISDNLKSGVTDRSRQRERERFKREIEELNQQMPDFGDFENWNEDEELAKAGLTPIKTSRTSLDAINNSSLKK
jgi:hypothetical protein